MVPLFSSYLSSHFWYLESKKTASWLYRSCSPNVFCHLSIYESYKSEPVFVWLSCGVSANRLCLTRSCRGHTYLEPRNRVLPFKKHREPSLNTLDSLWNFFPTGRSRFWNVIANFEQWGIRSLADIHLCLFFPFFHRKSLVSHIPQ